MTSVGIKAGVSIHAKSWQRVTNPNYARQCFNTREKEWQLEKATKYDMTLNYLKGGCRSVTIRDNAWSNMSNSGRVSWGIYKSDSPEKMGRERPVMPKRDNAWECLTVRDHMDKAWSGVIKSKDRGHMWNSTVKRYSRDIEVKRNEAWSCEAMKSTIT